MSVRILIGDMRERLKELPDASVDSVVCDPPYHLTSIVKRFSKAKPRANMHDKHKGDIKAAQYSRLSKGFMGQSWDGGDVAFQPDTWAEVLRVLKPGGHLIAFSGTRTYHRMAVAIEDAGFEIRDQLAWVYGSGFPKSHDVAKQIDKAAGAEREVVGPGKWAHVKGGGSAGVNTNFALGNGAPGYDATAPATDKAREWEGWGTALKPAWELARKPLIGTVAANVLKHGTGAINIDGCRIEGESTERHTFKQMSSKGAAGGAYGKQDHEYAERDEKLGTGSPLGRWPANIIHDGSDEVLAGFPETAESRVSALTNRSNGVLKHGGGNARPSHGTATRVTEMEGYADSGSAARFFYCAKTTTEERGEGNNHPTVKPKALMCWLVRLVTPKGGTVLDPFMGSGSTALACDAEQFNFVGCELSPEYAELARKRISTAAGLFADISVEHAGPSTRTQAA